MGYYDELRDRLGNTLDKKVLKANKVYLEQCTRFVLQYTLKVQNLGFRIETNTDLTTKLNVDVYGITGLLIASVSVLKSSTLFEYCASLYSELLIFQSSAYESGVNEPAIQLYLDFQDKYRRIKVIKLRELIHYNIQSYSNCFVVDTKFSSTNTLAVLYNFVLSVRVNAENMTQILDFILENLSDVTEMIRLLQESSARVLYSLPIEKVKYNNITYYCINRGGEWESCGNCRYASNDVYDSESMELVTDTQLKNMILSKLELIDSMQC